MIGSPTHDTGGRWRFPLLVGVETIGAVILFWHVVPHYRRVLVDPASFEARPETLVWALSSIALMQVGYWLRYRVRPPLPQVAHALLGHVLQFLGRMGFVLATSVCSFMFITPKPGFYMPASRYVVAIAGLFAIFCYTQELQRLGKACLGKE